MMLVSRYRLMNWFAIQFQINSFTGEDYRTMCELLEERYMPNNDEVRTNSNIKLIN